MTGVRQLIRKEPLETMVININGDSITLPSETEMLRIKAVLILKRNAVRDYIDFAALAEHLGDEKAAYAMRDFDLLYPQESGESSLQQLLAQLSNALPFDLDNTDLKKYKKLKPQYQDWNIILSVCASIAQTIFEKVLSPAVNISSGLKPKP
jgi:hypothetical protein